MPFTLHKNQTMRDASVFRRFTFLLAALMIFPVFSASCSKDAEVEKEIPADYGTYGADIAKQIAVSFPFRKAYSDEEKATGIFIRDAFRDLGYTVEEQTFASSDLTRFSTNYIVRIPGEGFMIPDETGKYQESRKTVVVGAHYDTVYGTQDAATVPGFDGIQDNAAGIGALLTLAEQMREVRFAYDVILVAFGAGDDSFTGAKTFLSAMTPEDVQSLDAMYCIESIYAGDKLYASAGMSSLLPDKKYAMRRKLYEAYDVVYENSLSSLYGVDLLYNQCGQQINLDGDPELEVYREVTMTLSDYVPFDQAGIPIVFFESYDYNFPTVNEMKETKNLDLQENGGLIRRTAYDSLDVLEKALPEGQLEKRINATAFIIFGAIQKGTHLGVSKSDYAAGITLAPSPTASSAASESSSSESSGS